MLKIQINESELWDENKQEFIFIHDHTLCLEHSLVSISKWESKWHKPFLSKESKTLEETLDYIRCMTITQNVRPEVYQCIDSEHIQIINHYIDNSMTATWFSSQRNQGGNREQVTSELIYYWMVALNIPFECQKWHLNRLLTLIKICNIKNQPAKRRSRNELMSRNAALNAARKKQLHSKG
ncbi:MAG: hypothetical protein HFF01_03220 [Erysipelotrichaceae bacterium]|nr:hypothetical protein [Erysipelotrichaceae bacterium]MCI9524042.1 hypothetical protein [Erysipelotrichaceae bacterium]